MIKFRAWDKNENEYFIDGNAGRIGNLICCEDLGMLDPNDYVWEQFTGLTDVNGKDIYVGDIVRYTRWADHVGIVRYFKPEFELQNIGTNIDIAPILTMRHELRIIGNVHDNPELLVEDHA